MTVPEHDATVHCARCGQRLVGGVCPHPYCTVHRLRTTGSGAQAASGAVAASPGDSDRSGTVWQVGLVALALLALAIAGLSAVVAVRAEHGLSAARADISREAAERERLRDRLTEMGADGARLRGSVQRLQARWQKAPDDSVVAHTAGRSVVTVITSDGSGSGFAVRESGGVSEIVTNFHVVATDYGAGRRTVEVARGGAHWTGRVVEVSAGNDLAVIEVRHRLPSLEVAARRPDVGSPVLVLGSPLGLGGTVTSGIVSAYRDDFDLDYLQFSAPISPGNSGGPVLDERGRVVGVAVAKMVADGAEGIGFAIPTSRLCVTLSVC